MCHINILYRSVRKEDYIWSWTLLNLWSTTLYSPKKAVQVQDLFFSADDGGVSGAQADDKSHSIALFEEDPAYLGKLSSL
jgi:hypothetical protein